MCDFTDFAFAFFLSMYETDNVSGAIDAAVGA